MTRGDLVADKAEEWIDVPFKWQGRVRSGCDCKGLPAGIAKELNFPEADSIYALAGDYIEGKVPIGRLLSGLKELFDKIPVSERQRGDLLLCKFGGAPQHLAIYAPKDGKPNRAIEAMPFGPWKVRPAYWPEHRIDSCWRWRNASP